MIEKKHFYYKTNILQLIRFTVLDGEQFSRVNNLKVKIDNEYVSCFSSTEPQSESSHSIYNPKSDTFAICVNDENESYYPYEDTACTYEKLSNKTIYLYPNKGSDWLNIKVTWSGTNDFDTTLYIMQYNVDKARLWYMTPKINNEIKLEYPENSNNYYTLNYDGDSYDNENNSYENEYHSENIFGGLQHELGLSYRIEVNDNDPNNISNNNFNDKKCTLEIRIGSAIYTYEPNNVTGKTWVACVIIEDDEQQWKVLPSKQSIKKVD